jgi:hypothetical protein
MVGLVLVQTILAILVSSKRMLRRCIVFLNREKPQKVRLLSAVLVAIYVWKSSTMPLGLGRSVAEAVPCMFTMGRSTGNVTPPP